MIKGIKSGMPFTATFMGRYTIHGHIYVSGTSVFLCHDDYNCAGNHSPNMLGHIKSYELYHAYKNKQALINSCKTEGWDELSINGIDMGVPATPRVGGYKFEEIGDGLIKFGCGAVILSKKQIASYMKVRKAKITPEDMQNFVNVENTISRKIDGGKLSDRDLKIIKEQILAK